jgi:hypothetical protein
MSAPELRAQLPPLPARLASLPVDERGYPVPFFVAWIDGKPDHRVADETKMPRAVKHGLCWMCGQALGAHKAFALGPMCAITRTVAEPPSHRECLQFAVQACPFLTRPRAQRREANLPEHRHSPGLPIQRNPGVIAIWVTRSYRPFQAFAGGGGMLFEVGPPESVEWWAEGRPATRDEVLASVSGGLPLLEEQARLQDEQEPNAHAVRRLHELVDGFVVLLSSTTPQRAPA